MKKIISAVLILAPFFAQASALEFPLKDHHSLARDMYHTVVKNIKNLTPNEETLNIFVNMDDVNHIYKRNKKLWAADFDLTSIPVEAGGGQTGKGILVAPDIVLSATHACARGTVYFVDKGDKTHFRTVTGTLKANRDICIAKLSSDLPRSIKFAYIFPADVIPLKISADLLRYKIIPLAYTNQFRTLQIGALQSYNNRGNDLTFIDLADSAAPFYAWWSRIIGGDSGNPAVTFVNNKTVAIGTWFLGGVTTIFSLHIPEINTAMETLGSPHKLSVIDLSKFTSNTE